jgi:hypothetical protein
MHRRVRVRARARVRVHVRVRAACDASHLLGRPDLGGCVVVVDGHILLPRVPYLVGARARVRVKVRPRQGWSECWSESVGVRAPPCSYAAPGAPCAAA